MGLLKRIDAFIDGKFPNKEYEKNNSTIASFEDEEVWKEFTVIYASVFVGKPKLRESTITARNTQEAKEKAGLYCYQQETSGHHSWSFWIISENKEGKNG